MREKTTRAHRALVVYSRVGGGHQSAARALAAGLEEAGGGRVRATASDIYLEQSRFPVTRFPALYARLARHHPRLWATLFHSTDGGRFDATPLLHPFMTTGLDRLFEQEMPDLVVSAMPMVNGLLARAVCRRSPRPRFEVVLTDWYDIHRTWLADGVDFYTTPTEPAARTCIHFGAPPERVAVVGIPVRSEFTHAFDRVVDRAAVWGPLGLDPRAFTILAMVGAEGSPRALVNIETLAALDIEAQLVVLCGRNERLRSRVDCLPSGLPRRTLGFVDHVADLMRATDLLITKAGGMTLAEAFCCGVPTVVNDVLPGQEAGNTTYALEHGAIEYAASSDQLAALVRMLRETPRRRAELASRARSIARPDAAARIATGMLERLEHATV